VCVDVLVAGTLERAAAAGNCTADFCGSVYVFVHVCFVLFLYVCVRVSISTYMYTYVCTCIYSYMYIPFFYTNWVTFKCIHIKFARQFKYIHLLQQHLVGFQIYSCTLNLAGDSLQSTGDALNVQIQAAHSDLVELRIALRAKTASLEACHTYISHVTRTWVQSHMNE